MAGPITWDILVHPFFSLGYVEMKPQRLLSPELKRRLLANANVLREIWGRRISFLSSHPNRGLIILVPAFNQKLTALRGQNLPDHIKLAEEGERFCDELKSFAFKNLGHDRCAIAPPGIGIELSLKTIAEAKGISAGISTGAVMGEYTDVCVKEAADYFSKLTGQKVRIAARKGLNLMGATRVRSAELARLHRTAFQRAERKANAKAKKAVR